ncbi:MAG: nucleoside triphosphate pyrophosphohydrolase [Bryobacteraceae bacterium]|nr:nucleoside triphosphate pyrophosphohydrolase [Bryobacteraceae bacterium]
MNPHSQGSAGTQLEELLRLMSYLRSPQGCPWDREQTFDSIKPFTLEETYEVLDAIDARDWNGLRDELGDFLLQAVFYAQMAEEAGHFRMEDCLRSINEKLVRRHPHVFGKATADTADEVKQRWDEIKATESKSSAPATLLGGVSRSTPALMEALKISEKAAGSGFEWPTIDGVLDKVSEEIGELQQARSHGSKEDLESEFGDLLFTLVNLGRFLKLDPEQALRKTNSRFRERFGFIERKLAEHGRSLKDADLEEMEALWQLAKVQAKVPE